MATERNLTRSQCNEIGARIIRRFYDNCDGGAQFGIDWRTARIIWPRQVRVFERLRRQYLAAE